VSYRFLTGEWFDAMQRLLDEGGEPELPDKLRDLRLNVRIRDEDTGDVAEVSYCGCYFRPATVDGAPTLTTTRDLAYRVMIEKNIVLGVRALATGQAKIKGDRRRLLALRSVQPSPEQAAFEQRVREMTVL
jgi:hypothetical protein